MRIGRKHNTNFIVYKNKSFAFKPLEIYIEAIFY